MSVHISCTLCEVYLNKLFSLKSSGQSHKIEFVDRSFERVGEFKYLGTILTNQNSILEKIKSRLKSWNACHHSVQNLLSSVCYPKI